MKNIFVVLSVLFLTIGTSFGQIQVPEPSCAYCNRKQSTLSTSGHASNCPYYKPVTSGNTQQNKTVPAGPSLEQVVMQSLMQNIIQSMFTPQPANTQLTEQQKAEQLRQEQLAQQQLAAQIAALKRYKDSIAEVKHNTMKSFYKSLDSGDVRYKELDQRTTDVKFNCVITDYSGKVIVARNNGSRTSLSEISNLKNRTLMEGDWIYVPEGGNYKMHFKFEEGGKDMIFGANTMVNIVRDEEGHMVPNIIRGSVSLSSSTKVNLNGKEYNVKNILDEQAAYSNEEYLQLKREYMKLKQKMHNKLNVRTPTAICGVRGTSYIITADSVMGTEVCVFSGKVNVTDNVNFLSIVVEKGYKVIVGITGEIIGPTKMTESELLKEPD